MVVDVRLLRVAGFLVLAAGFVPTASLPVAYQLAGPSCQLAEGAVSAQPPVTQGVAKNKHYPFTRSSTKAGLLPTSVAYRARRQSGDLPFRSFITTGLVLKVFG